MKANTPNNPKDLQAQRLRLHGLDVILARQGGTTFQKLVLTRPTSNLSGNARRLPIRRQ